MASMKVMFLLLALLCFKVECKTVKGPHHKKHNNNNHHHHHRGPSQTLVLAPPIIDNEYYTDRFKSVIPFYKRYVEAISAGTDGVVLVVDDRTKPYYEHIIDPKVLLEGHIDDPWTRDVGTPIPSVDVQFTYVGGSTQKEADNTQGIFNKFIHSLGVKPYKTYLKVDGGNMVNNNGDKVITTTKFMKDNNLTKSQAVKAIKEELGVEHVSILTPDEPKLAHSDGMASYVCNNTIYMHKQSEPDFNQLVKDELLEGCPQCRIVEVEGFLDERVFKEGYASSCGVYVNCVVTDNYIYVPQFGEADLDKAALNLYKQNPCGKKVVPIDVNEVCVMGGSLRCLSWQTTGKTAQTLKSAAAKDDAEESGSGEEEEYDVVEKSKQMKKRAFNNIQEKIEKMQRELKNIKRNF